MGAHRQCDFLILMLLRHLQLGLSCHHVGPAVRGVLPVLVRGRGPTGSAVGARRPDANCGHRSADSTGCWRPIPPRPGSTSRPARISTPRTSHSRSPPAWLLVGQEVRDRMGDGRAATGLVQLVVGHRVGFAGGCGGPSFDSFDSALSSSIGAYTASQSSSSSSGGGGGAAAAAAAAAAVAEEEVAHGEIPADRGAGARSAGADRYS